MPSSLLVIKSSFDDAYDTEEIDYLKLILTARVYDVATESPLQLAKNLSSRLGNSIYLKREDLQSVFSFKCRGAFNKISQLTDEEKARGVIAVSAGNHAQGVALASQRLKIKSVIVMPKGTPDIKSANVIRLGSQVIFHGNDFDEAKEECMRLAKEHNYTIIHPYDDPYVIAGQGTVGVEIIRQHSGPIDCIFVCVGGGGLISGIATFIKRIRPEIKVIGVNAEDSDSMTKAIREGKRVELSEVGLFADGTAIKIVGKETFRLAKKYVDEMITVSTDEICAAIKDTFMDTRSIIEPSGALALAGCKKYALERKKKDEVYVAVLSGANMNFDRLRFVVERARLGEKREILLFTKLIEKPGNRHSNKDFGKLIIAFETVDRVKDMEILSQKFAENQIEAIDISDDELSKTHARFLCGGTRHVESAENAGFHEKIFRFRFQERPGALKKFVDVLNQNWDISLLHYRNLGGDVGRILVGFRVHENDEESFAKSLELVGFPYVDETNSEICKKLFD